MTTVVTAADAAQFLSLVPHLLGFTPARSMVLVPFARGRSLGALRCDLPAPPTGEEQPRTGELESVASTCLGMICRVPEADAVAAVVYADADLLPGDPLPGDALVRAIAVRADACGITMTQALCVGADAWGDFLADADAPRLRPLTDIAAPADHAPAAPTPEADQWAGAALPDVGPSEADAVAQAVERLRSALALLCGEEQSAAQPVRVDPLALAAVGRLDNVVELFDELLGWEPSALSPFDAAVVAWCLSRASLRDIAIVQWAGGRVDGEHALDAQLRWEGGELYPADLAERMWGEGGPPTMSRVRSALAVVRRVAALVPQCERPGPLATCAWLSWALGRSTHAESYAKRALAIEPDHGLAEIVRSFVRVGHLPGWAFSPAGR